MDLTVRLLCMMVVGIDSAPMGKTDQWHFPKNSADLK